MTDHNSGDRSPAELDAVGEQLRNALAHHTASVEPRPDGLQRIEAQLMAPTSNSRTTRIVLGVLAAAAIALVAFAVVAQDDDDPEITADQTTTTADSTTTSTTDPTTSTTVAEPTINSREVVFPDISTSRRFDDPVAAARAFAVDFVGFVDPIVGEFQQGDSRSGEVEIRGFAQGTPTVVFVRQLADESWGVIGCSTENVTVTTPEVDDVVTSPTDLAGTALAFEGNVAVQVKQQGAEGFIGESFVTGSGSPPAGPFEGSVEFSSPTVDTGAILFLVRSAEDGRVIEATVVRVQFT